MENQKKPLLIRPSMTPKTLPKKNCSGHSSGPCSRQSVEPEYESCTWNTVLPGIYRLGSIVRLMAMSPLKKTIETEF